VLVAMGPASFWSPTRKRGHYFSRAMILCRGGVIRSAWSKMKILYLFKVGKDQELEDHASRA
jgi:hypothetical protein